ncbi:TonB-dependent receptor [Opitutus sp. ER46]|uniref:TonB-dependent receptor domain-containing protein n=1 Tax=Opitutus sp. ER46 TaxID=2161864 RepID=UPI000D2FB693|nr:TonB-dependent receptor [Opitutus sp. ER46]PTX91555.1 TonB-dependent receptor [Opitutus sp. ER46]
MLIPLVPLIARLVRRTGASALLLLPFLSSLALAQPATGVVIGRVYHTGTKEYVRNAEVRVEGTNVSAFTEDAGFYRLAGVPAGEVRVTVTYTGAQSVTDKVVVTAGATATRDFELQAMAASENVITLETVSVVAEREGQSKAIMERRAAPNAKNVVASDNYGDLTMGDVGEFMKSMPGLSLDYVEVDTSAVRVGGLDPKYSNFTTDGARMPTGTSNNNAGRQNSFEQMSITGIESIEFNNTLTANMDADSPGGSINLRSKYAFQRRHRELSFQFGGVGTSDSHLRREYFPDDKKHSRIFPTGQISFGDVYFHGRLGVEFSLSYSANFVEQDRHQLDWIYPSKYPDGIPYRAMWRAGPKETTREAANLSIDYKLTDRLTLSLRSTYSDYAVEYVNQYTFLYFGSTSTSNVAAGSTPTHIIGSGTTNTRVATEYSHRFADTPVILFAPKIEYKGDTYKATLRGSYSNARYNFRAGMKGFFQRDDSAITNLGGFVMDRPDSESIAWTITQTNVTPTNDWSNPENWKAYGTNSVRDANSDTTNEMFSGYLDFEKDLWIRDQPIKVLTGGGTRTNSWNSNEGGYVAYTFVGPTGVQNQATVPYTKNYQAKIIGFDAGNFNDLNWRADSNYATYDLFREHPEYFLQNDTGNLQRRLANTKGLIEQISAAYVEAQTRYKKMRFDFGVRYERTGDTSKIWDVRPAKDVYTAGYKVIGSAAQVAADPAHYVLTSTGAPAAGFASTPEGIIYQYNNGVQGRRHSSYGNWFKSGGIKFDFTRKLVGQIAFSDAILRPDYGNLAGATSVSDTNNTVTVPNPKLKPEKSTKYYAGLQYFLEPSGVVGVSFYRLRLQDMQVTGQEIADPTTIGYSDTDYPGYRYLSAQNDPSVRYTNGLTFEYNQQLTFLPRIFKGFGLYGSVTRVMADGIRVNTPNKSANWGLKYSYRRFRVQVNGSWQGTARTSALSATPTTVNGGVLYRASRELWGISAGYKLTSKLELMVSGRNIFNAPDIVYSNVPGHLQQYSIYGSLWTAGIKGRF